MRLFNRYALSEIRLCDVCDGHDFEQLAHLRSPRIPDYSAPVAICRSCGFVTVRPRPNSSAYREINRRWYPFKFSADPPSDKDPDKKFRKWRTMWDRIETRYADGPRQVLDIGAGQGWAIEFLKSKRPSLAAVAIEQWKPSQDYIRNELGAEVVDVDLNEDWPASLGGRFELVIFRHTIEHLEEPLKALRQIHRCLADGGYAYIVCPNAETIRPDRAVRTDFLRPVHLHYFNRTTLQRLAIRADLVADVFDSRGELWGLFRKRRDNEPVGDVAGENSYERQRKFLAQRLRGARWRDLISSARMGVRHFLARSPLATVADD